MVRAIRAILLSDTQRLVRDRFLLGMGTYIVVCAVVLRWLLPWLESELGASSGFAIGPYVPLVVSYFIVINASVLTGMIGGFLLLESREERTIKAALVTPTPLSVHLATLGALIVAAGTAVAVVEAALVGVGIPPWDAVIASALLGAPMGIVMSLILATVAANKVEAFAVMKITSILGLLPVGAYFIPEPFQYVAGLIPAYWACKIWWEGAFGATDWWWMLVPGVLTTVLWIALLLPRFRAAAYR